MMVARSGRAKPPNRTNYTTTRRFLTQSAKTTQIPKETPSLVPLIRCSGLIGAPGKHVSEPQPYSTGPNAHMLHVPTLFALMLAPQPVVLPQPLNQPAPSNKQPSLEALSNDQIIQRLPRLGADGSRDRVRDPGACVAAMKELMQRVDAGVVFNGRQWQAMLERTGVLRYRTAWPQGVPIIVAMQDFPETMITLVPRDKTLNCLSCGSAFELCGTGLEEKREKRLHQVLGTLSPCEHNLIIDARLIAPGGPPPHHHHPPRIVYQGEFSLPFNIVPTLEDAMPSDPSPELVDAVRQSIGVAFTGWGPWRKPAAVLVFDGDTAAHPVLATSAVSLKCTLLRSGVQKSSTKLVISARGDFGGATSVYARSMQFFSAGVLADLQGAAPSADEAAKWSIRVEGTDGGVLELWHADKRWTGSFEMPLSEAIKTEQARVVGKPPRTFTHHSLGS